jgi:hypothetical protein
MSDEEVTTHPSYGQVVFSRITGGGSRLYGSAIRKHGSSITLSIKRSDQIDRDGTVWHHSREELIEVELSSSQFAALITTMNVGSGIPCTIRRLNNKGVEGPPDDEPLNHERVGRSLANDGEMANRINGSIDEALEAVDAMLAGKSLKKSELKLVREKLQKARTNVRSNLPFVLTRFREEAEKVKTTVMAEADAWLTSVVQRAGLTALTGKGPQIEMENPKQIDVEDSDGT